MKAALVEKFGSIVVRDVPDPQLGDYDALCELLYGATCTGTDSHIIAGTFPWISPLPTILGHESVGRVVAVGSKVRNFRVGDLVTRVGAPACPDKGISVTWGGFAQTGVARDHWAMAADGLPEKQWKGHRVNQVVPPSVDPRVAPMFTTWRETLSYLLRAGFSSGQSILIVGSGGNALSFAAMAAILGAGCVAMVGAARAAEAAARVGVSAYCDYRQPQLTDNLKAQHPGGFDFVLDAVGKSDTANQVLPLLKPDGRLAIYGIDDFRKVAINPTLARGGFTFQYCGGYDEAETHQRVSEMVLQGRLNAGVWYDLERPYRLVEIGAAFEAVRDRRAPKALVDLRRV